NKEALQTSLNNCIRDNRKREWVVLKSPKEKEVKSLVISKVAASTSKKLLTEHWKLKYQDRMNQTLVKCDGCNLNQVAKENSWLGSDSLAASSNQKSIVKEIRCEDLEVELIKKQHLNGSFKRTTKEAASPDRMGIGWLQKTEESLRFLGLAVTNSRKCLYGKDVYTLRAIYQAAVYGGTKSNKIESIVGFGLIETGSSDLICSDLTKVIVLLNQQSELFDFLSDSNRRPKSDQRPDYAVSIDKAIRNHRNHESEHP
ncbi:1295_t:CDS:2, partial [Racocetra persica]